MLLLNKRNCIFCCTGRPLLWILRFCGLILAPLDNPKWDRESAFLLFFYKSVHVVPKWDRQAVIFGTVFSLFSSFCIRVAEAQSFAFNELCGLWRADRQVGRPFERSRFEKVQSKQFCG